MNWRLTSDELTVDVKSLGAELTSVKSRRNGTEYLWQADPKEWARHAPLLFPVVGKLKGDTYFYNGGSYKLPQHGFARDMEFDLVSRSQSHVELTLASSPSTKANYPFDFLLSVTYQLKGAFLGISYGVTNPGTSPLLYSIGAHPAFRVPLAAGEKRADYELIFEHEEKGLIAALDGGLRTGEVKKSPIDRKNLSIDSNLFDNDALVFGKLASGKITIGKKGSPAFLLFFSESPYFGIWSKSATSEFVCLEPWWGIADSVVHNQAIESKEGIRVLGIGEQEKFEYGFEIVI